MPPVHAATDLLRDGLLDGQRVLLVAAGPPRAATADAVHEGCAALGAAVALCEADRPSCADEAAMDALVGAALGGRQEADALVIDGAGMFAAAAGGAAGQGTAAGSAPNDAGDHAAGLRECLQGTWNATRAAAEQALLPAGRGRIVLLAPAASAGGHAPATRAGLENLARTLSIEWARHGLTVVAVGEGQATPAGELAALVAFILSPAGAYLSGCLLAPA